MSRARPVAKKRQRARVEQRARTRAARHSGPSLAGERMQWAAALAASSILLVVLRAIFVAMQPRIVGAGATVDPALITPWVRWAVLPVSTDRG